jgi:hypothetical protein
MLLQGQLPLIFPTSIPRGELKVAGIFEVSAGDGIHLLTIPAKACPHYMEKKRICKYTMRKRNNITKN